MVFVFCAVDFQVNTIFSVMDKTLVKNILTHSHLEFL